MQNLKIINQNCGEYFLVNEDITIAQLGYTVFIIFRANERHLFNIEKHLQKDVEVFYEMPNSNIIFQI